MMSDDNHMCQQLFVKIWQVYKDADACMYVVDSGLRSQESMTHSQHDGDVAFRGRLFRIAASGVRTPDSY
jgi:hypothetical protein